MIKSHKLPLKVAYTYSSSDIDLLYWEGYLFWRRTVSLLIALFALTTLVFVLIDSIAHIPFSFNWGFLVAFVAGLIALMVRLKLLFKKRREKILNKKSVMIIYQNKIVIQSKDGDSKHTFKKDDIKNIFKRRNFIFLSLVNSLVSAIAIPKRFFTKEQESALFCFCKKSA